MKKGIVETGQPKLINEPKLNLACGQTNVEGYFGIDIVPGNGVNAVVDLEQFPWPIESNSAEDIIVSHFVEHLTTDTFNAHLQKAINNSKTFEDFKKEMSSYDERIPSDGLIAFMDEVYRILKPGGKIKVIAPYYSSVRAWQDPTHRRAISEVTFFYFNKGWRDANKLDHYGVKSDFDFTYGYDISNDWATKHEEARAFAIRHYINVINDIHVVLTKR